MRNAHDNLKKEYFLNKHHARTKDKEALAIDDYFGVKYIDLALYQILTSYTGYSSWYLNIFFDTHEQPSNLYDIQC